MKRLRVDSKPSAETLLFTVQARVLKHIIEGVKDLIPAVTIVCSQPPVKIEASSSTPNYHPITIVSLDVASVCLVEVQLAIEPSGLKKYEFTSQKSQMMLGVCVMTLHRYINSINDEDVLTVFYNLTDEPDILRFTATSSTNIGVTNDTSFKLMHIETDSVSTAGSNFNIDWSINVKCREIARICKCFNNTGSETIEICISSSSSLNTNLIDAKNILVTFTSSADSGMQSFIYDCTNQLLTVKNHNNEIEKEPIQQQQKDEEEAVETVLHKSTYALKYFVFFTRSESKTDDFMTILLGNNIPIRMEYNLANNGAGGVVTPSSKSIMRYYLAPKQLE